MANTDEPILTAADRQSALWLKLKAHMEARTHRMRVKNDKPADAEKTATLRGHIAELRILMALDSPAPSIQADDPLFKD